MTRMCRDCERCDEQAYCSSLKAKLIIPFAGNCSYFRRKQVGIKEAYEVMQAEWVKLYDVKVGDTVKILREMETDELGCKGYKSGEVDGKIGRIITIRTIHRDHLSLSPGGSWPFFCLELVKKAEPVIEIDVKINGVTSKLSDISQETLLNIRDKT